MKVAIVGCGAMGSVYAGMMAEAGNEVWAVDLWREHVDAIRAGGLRLEGASGDRLIGAVRAAHDVAEIRDVELYIIATKANGVAAAARSIAPVMSADSMVLAMQNGLGAGARLAAPMPAGARLLLGVAQGFGASMRGPGCAHHNGMARVLIGALAGGPSADAERVAQLWRSSGFTAEAYEDIDRLIWEKFIFNCAFSAPCAVFGRTVAEMLDDPATRAFSLGCAAEAAAVARARGVALGFDDVEAYVLSYAEGVRGARPSMLLDHMAKRRSEIDFINGAVPEHAAEFGIATPFNTSLTDAIRAREASFPN